MDDRVEFFYRDADAGVLRHAWRDPRNLDWFFEVLDGDGPTPDGRVQANANIGRACAAAAPPDPNGPSVLSRRDSVHVLYEGGILRPIRLAKRG